MIKPQNQFPLLEKYKEHFAITEYTIFAYGEDIYTNYELTPDLLIHEEQHLKQQRELGLDKWVELYLNNRNYRLLAELDAYRVQLKSIKDKNQQYRVKRQSAQNLSSDLYGNLVTFNKAMDLLSL